jgi:23S rRNA-/tRNA-specific pseudouridylate synthase
VLKLLPCLKGLPAPLHRLGRGTSGLLLCACSPQARRQLSAAFADHDGKLAGSGLRKVYRALVSGLLADDEVGQLQNHTA